MNHTAIQFTGTNKQEVEAFCGFTLDACAINIHNDAVRFCLTKQKMVVHFLNLTDFVVKKNDKIEVVDDSAYHHYFTK